MKFSIQLVMTIFLTVILQLFMPWWSSSIAAFIISVIIGNKSYNSFFAGFSSISLTWMLYSAIINSKASEMIAIRIVPVFGIKSILLLILITGLIGGIVGGIAALCGTYFKDALLNNFFKQKSEFGYLK